jgi:transposase
MPTSLDSLPDDPAVLKRIITDLQQDHAAELDSVEQDHEQQVDSLKQDHAHEIETLKEQLRLALKREFGRSSEAAPGQGELFNEAEQVTAEGASADESETEVLAHRRRKPGRKPLPAHLPRIEVVYELDDAERTCPNDGEMLKEIGEETSEVLDIVPAKIRVIRRLRKKYACPVCESHVARAPMPNSLIPKSIASPSLLAQIALYKYQDALPLYRQEQVLERMGVTVSRTTQANWMIKTGQALKPA